MKNRKWFPILGILTLLIFSNCARVRTFSTGLDNDAFLEFVGNPKDFKGGVDVTIDEQIKFKAQVKKDYSAKPTGFVYSISKGTHILTISYNNKLLYNNKIFVSPQETKKIVLP